MGAAWLAGVRNERERNTKSTWQRKAHSLRCFVCLRAQMTIVTIVNIDRNAQRDKVARNRKSELLFFYVATVRISPRTIHGTRSKRITTELGVRVNTRITSAPEFCGHEGVWSA